MNKRKMVFLFLLVSVLLFAGRALANPEIVDILQEIDRLTELKQDGTARVEITRQKAGQGTKVYQAIYYRRDQDDSFLIVMTAPESEKGNGYLRKGDNFWMYRRNTGTFQQISLDKSIAGSTTLGENFGSKKLFKMYRPLLNQDGQEQLLVTKLGEIPVYQFKLTARVEDISYPQAVFWVRKDNYLPLKHASYSLNGTLMQTVYYLKYTRIEDKYLVVKYMIIDEFEKGNKTIVEVKNLSLQALADHIFTKEYLASLSNN